MGELAALLSAMLWALSSAMMGAQAGRVPPAVISAVRLLGATITLWAVCAALYLAGRLDGVSAMRAAALIGTGILGPGIGDTLYLGSVRSIGLARAFPISMAGFPLFTVVLAALLVGEAITLPVVGGGVLIVAGVYLIAAPRMDPAAEVRGANAGMRFSRLRPADAGLAIGLGLVLIAALTWALASVWVRDAAEGVAPALVGAIRMPAAGVFAALWARRAGQRLRPGHYGRRAIWLLFTAGVLGTGLGSVLWVIGVQQAGAARTALLSSTAPLFALPLAALYLHERITGRVVAGTVLSIVGIGLVTV